MKKQINALPAPTFRWLKMNGTLLEETDLPSDPQIFTAAAGTEQYLMLLGDGTQGDPSEAYHLVVEKDAVLHLVEVVKDAGEAPYVREITAECAEGALLHVYWIFLGGKAVYPSVTVDLNGAGSRLEMDGAYVVRPKETLDMSVVSNHYGARTESRIEVRGVLYDRAKKIFRGTIDFKRGCKGASGDEREEVLLMDDEAVNQTVPLILCAEEDVAGNHGASIGRIDEDAEFYLESRGLSPEEVEQILLDARINSVIGKLPAQVRCTVGNAIGSPRTTEGQEL